eukprot:CAMPEP_0172570078 /NCGR_PEP_ID=MMETSP1067-20121228/126088_1 /TAXON_ID=265564 ORGANISM="Thalassiosira punctigera, Strain Tpunct2005C2" /NCGR_SAMPLE_ID=MMETSP1067 /ASSEMBLY_ACC=CAM_ASM_000444 /LENGTH=48 /DNA_ID= /DNA_START= /DNA_END= /DNA_ORIENTATION=
MPQEENKVLIKAYHEAMAVDVAPKRPEVQLLQVWSQCHSWTKKISIKT